MKVLVVGGGGREHALAWAIHRSPQCERLFVAPGNAGTAAIAENVSVPAEDVGAIVEFVKREGVDLTVVGPEAPLVLGLCDELKSAGYRCFGPTRANARLEGSKVFAKDFMKKHGIPTAEFEVFDDAGAAERYVESCALPVVVKADGLAQGKGVVVAGDAGEAKRAISDIMVQKKYGCSGDRLVVEEFLSGEEVSAHAVCGGGRAILFPSSQDHKRIFDGDRGPNTGGMGAYAPVPLVTDDVRGEILEKVIQPTIRGMEHEGETYDGVLYAGLMMTADGPKVLEYNVRFGDPETQVLLPLLKSDFLKILYDAAGRSLPPDDEVEFYDGRFAANVVVAAKGYPGSYEKGIPIRGLETIDSENRTVFHAGTAQTDGGVVTTGGRVLGVTAWSDDLRGAIKHAYEGVGRVDFDGAYWRSDIGKRAL